ENWLAYGRNYSEQRYSPLEQVNADNVGRLGLAWSMALPEDRSLLSTPLIVDGVMYFTGSWSKTRAVDARTGKLLWEYDPESIKHAGGERLRAMWDSSRGLAYWKGKLVIAPIRFRDESHLFQIAQRIVNQVGRRVDQTTPLADARLKDGSRVNVIVPPLSLRGTAISIRKFSEKPITLDMLKDFGSMSEKMATCLKIAGACRMNIVISGGTGSGKTTMLNALSKMIDPGERVLTIEDAAELRLQQPHWLPLETRPPNLEGQGAITIGDLVKNALRMRPDRIILGEIRGAECFDLLAAMNTGHDGSMCTLHANSARECLGRMENMILMGDIKIPKEAISRQIAESVDLIVQVKRLRDGSRRTTGITEVIGMEGDVIVTQELFKFEYLDESEDGKIIGEFRPSGLRPYTLEKARMFGFDQAYLEACL
ncbi:MAG: hypothetical protein B7Z36_04065, partial [Novosphingobium sp. 12-63-9]